MKKAEVAIGGEYLAKVSGRMVKVKVTAVSPYGGWRAINLETNRTVRVRSSQRLRCAASSCECKEKPRSGEAPAKPSREALDLLVKEFTGYSGVETSYGTKELWGELEHLGLVTKMLHGGFLGHPFYFNITEKGCQVISGSNKEVPQKLD